MKDKFIILAVCIFCLLTQTTVFGAELQMIVNAGGHSAIINDIQVTRDRSAIITAANDKTIRVWDVPTLKESRKILGEVSLSAGMVRSIALSPDNISLVSAGEFPGNGGSQYQLRLHNFKTGAINLLIAGQNEVATSVRYSEDGKYLVSASRSGRICIYDVSANYALLRTIENGAFVNVVRIIKNDKKYSVIAVDKAGKISQFGLNGEQLRQQEISKTEIYSLAVSDTYIAAGSEDGIIQIFDHTLSKIKTIKDATKYEQLFLTVNDLSFSPDGQYLLVGSGAYRDWDSSAFVSPCRILKAPDFKSVGVFKENDRSVKAVAFLDDATAITAGGNNSQIFLWSVNDRSETGKIVSASRVPFHVGLNGNSLAFGFTDKQDNDSQTRYDLIFNLVTHALQAFPSNMESAFNQLSVSRGAYSLESSEDGLTLTVKRNGHESARIRPEAKVYSYGMINNDTILVGTSSAAIMYTTAGSKVAVFEGHSGIIHSIAVYGSRMATASDDHTIKLWDLSAAKPGVTVQPLVSFLYTERDKENPVSADDAIERGWVLWTPDGYYDASAYGAQHIGFHLNRGEKLSGLFVSADQVYEQFLRADIMNAVITGKPVGRKVTVANLAAALVKNTPPTVEIITSAQNTNVRDVLLEALVCDNGGGIGNILLKSNGVTVSRSDGTVAENKQGKGPAQPLATTTRRISNRPVEAIANAGTAACKFFSLPASLQSGENRLSIVAFDRNNRIESNQERLVVAYDNSTVTRALHVISLGINKYSDVSSLHNSVNDASAIASVFNSSAGVQFSGVKKYLYKDDEVTVKNLDTLFEQLQKTVSPDDMVILFIASHGVFMDQNAEWYMIPGRFKGAADSVDNLEKNAISRTVLQNYLARLSATRSVILIDSCYSGGFITGMFDRKNTEATAVSKFARATGRGIISASSTQQEAIDRLQGQVTNNGLFTSVVLEGLKGAADYGSRDHKITLIELAQYAQSVVSTKSSGRQVPQYSLVNTEYEVLKEY